MHGEPFSVLIAEDEPAHIEAIQRALEAAQVECEVLLAGTLEEARQAIATRTPDIVLADLNLADGKAFELLSADAEAQPYPVLVMTSHGDEQMAVHALKSGALDYVVKTAETFIEMPRLLERALREWRHIQDHRRAERALRESERRLADIIDFLPDATFAVDADGRVIAWNRAVERMTGTPKEKVLGRGEHAYAVPFYGEARPMLLDLILGDDPDVEKRYDFVERDGDHLIAEVFDPHLYDGRGAYLWTTASPFYDSAGRVVGAIESVRDITEPKRAQTEIARAYGESRAITEAVRDALYMIDPHGRLLWWNKRVEEITGLAPEALQGRPYEEFFVEEDAPKLRAAMHAALTTGYGEAQARVKTPDGVVPYHYNGVCVYNERGQFIGITGVGRDISEQLRAQERLRLSATVLESTREGVMITDPQGAIVAVNHAFTEITGYTEQEVLDKRPDILHSGRQDRSFYRGMWVSIMQTGHWQGEIWNRRKNGEIFPEWLTISAVRNPSGEVTNYVGVFSDISRIKQSEEQLEHLAHYDPLTDLPNRLLLISRLGHAIEQARRHKHSVAVLFVDLDRFKNVNDSLGHPAGDELLQAIAERIRERVRSDDTLARLGGDEFVVVMESLQRPEEAAAVAQAIIGLLDAPFQLSSGRDIYLGASIGISLYPDNGLEATELVRNADTAMYQAKAHGRNTYRFYTEALTQAANERLEMESQLRRALEKGELLLHYQPQVSIPDGRIVGIEALVRWQHPTRGLIPPERFIPLAEETGLIVPLGEWVLRAASTQVRRWLDAGLRPITLAVNLSPRQFAHAGLETQVASVLAETRLPPELLELELTESAIMERGEEAVLVLQAHKELGIAISIDDFGTGYSSLAYLKRLPIDKLKVDKSFVQGIPGDRNDVEIVSTIIAMARNLQLRVLAEGVETEEQRAFLSEQGCDAYQGHLFSPALPTDRVEALLMPS